MTAIIDLIYVEYTDGREMSCAVIYPDDHSKDKMFGPFPAKNAVSALAPLVAAELPERFASVKAAEDHLTFVHVRNMTNHENSAGQSYPFKVSALAPPVDGAAS